MVAYSRVRDGGICQPVRNYISILTTGTASMVVNSTSLAQARLCTPKGVQNMPDPLGETQGAQSSLLLPLPKTHCHRISAQC